ncbi:MAG: MgtC/SapB family protein [Bacilli bacterium]|nr:MgtC/SapB family protein [Bacilli bacterium]
MRTIDQVIADLLGSWTIGEDPVWPIGNFVLCTIALLLSILLCGIIGIEREIRGRSAGLRTHLLVGVGSCIIMIISIYGFPYIPGYTRDVARLAAQVITGVGFLGAGAIIHRNSGTKGLTTAATIWIVMAIGLACGSMNFILAIGSTILIVVVLTFFRRVEAALVRKAPLIKVKAASDTPIATRILEIAAKSGCAIHDLQVDTVENNEVEAIFLATSNQHDFDPTEFIAKLEAVEGVVQVGFINSHKG